MSLTDATPIPTPTPPREGPQAAKPVPLRLPPLADVGSGPRAEIVMDADAPVGLGLASWGRMARGLWRSRELTWRLFLRDMTSGYRQSALGYLWAIVPTLFTAATFAWLNKANLVTVKGTTLPYPVFVLLNTTVWQFFSAGITALTMTFVSSGALVTKTRFPRECLLLSTLGRQAFDLSVRSLFVAGAFALFRADAAWTAVFAPLAILPLALLTVGLGCFLTLANAVVRDVGHFLFLLLTFWMFLTPVVYPPAVQMPQSLLNVVNPVSPFVIAVHDLVALGFLTQPGNFTIGCAVSLVVFLVGWRFFHVAERYVIERI